MTPEEARDLLDGTTPGPWFFDDDMAGTVHTIGPIVPCGNELDCSTDDAALAAHAPDMAAMIAGMREEWGVSYRWANDDAARIEWGNDTRDEAVKWARKLENYPGSRAYVFGIVRRYVTTEEEIS